MALCTEFPCMFRSEFWEKMRLHYKTEHKYIERPDKLFTKEWRDSK